MQTENSLLYYIWLTQCCDYNPKLTKLLLDKFKTVEEIYKANFYHPNFYKLLNLKNILKMDTNLDGSKRILEKCRKENINLISIDDENYPQRMKQMDNPPLLLYAKGKLPDLNRILGITIVGSRYCTENGRRIAEMLGRKLADSGFVIVGGMARGIDGAAHCGALSAGGTTLAVLAGGVDRIYPAEYAKLYSHILEHGAVLSERPPGVLGQGYFYKQRNRIMVGLSVGIVIVEGEKISGTSITAKIASNSNRDIFAVPGNPLNKTSELPNSLIKDGAKLTVNALDVMEEYIEIYPEMLEYGLEIKGKPVTGRLSDLSNTGKNAGRPAENFTPHENRLSNEKIEEFLKKSEFYDDERIILRYLWESGGTSLFDDIAENCKMEAAALSSKLIILQMKKAVLQSAGGQYTLNINITG